MQLDPTLSFENIDDTAFDPVIFDSSPLEGNMTPSVGDGPFVPFWHASPPPQSLAYMMFNFASRPSNVEMYRLMNEYHDTMFAITNFFLGIVVDLLVGEEKHKVLHDNRHKQIGAAQPHGTLSQPVFSGLDQENSEVVGYLMGIMAFDAYLIDLLPDGVNGIDVVVGTTCGDKFTYR